MRIVDVAAFYTPHGGGVKTYIDRKLAAGPKAGHEVVVIAPGPENRVEERGPGARIIYLKEPHFPLDRKYHYFRNERALHAALDEAQPDIVEASSPWRSARLVGEWPGHAPRVLIMHADPLSAYAYRWFGKIASRPAIDRGFGWFIQHLRQLDDMFNATVTAGQSLTDRLIEIGMTDVVTNPMGVSDDKFSPIHRDEALRARLLERCSLPATATLLLAAGRHAPEKRWPMVIEAVTGAGTRAPVGLILLGDGRERGRVARAAAANPHIELITPISDRTELARVFASADALIHGCEAETFCMVAAEARASGLPVIVPDQGGAADHGRDSDGWLYASADTMSATEAIASFLETPREPVRARAVAGAGDIRTMDNHFADLFAHYESIIAKPFVPRVTTQAARQLPFVAAIELGGTKVNVAVGSHPSKIVDQVRIPTTTPQETIAAAIDFLRPHADQIEAIGIASFGPITLDTGSSEWARTMTTVKPGWDHVDIAQPFIDAFGVPVALDTDVNGAAIGEYRWGNLAGTSVGLYLTVGTGIGGGVLINGRPLHGMMHPEMGHIQIAHRSDDFAGVCSAHGNCIEGLASGPAIEARLGRSLSEVAEDDPARAAIIDELGQALATLVLTLSPSRVVIGGGVAKAPGFHDQVAARMRRWLGGYLQSRVIGKDSYVTPPALGDLAGIAGGIALAQDLIEAP